VSTHEDFSRKLELKGPTDRSFGWVLAIFLIFVGIWPTLHAKPMRKWALAAALVVCAFTILRPGLLHPANVAWMKFGLLLSKFVNPIVTGLLFYLVITPMGLLMRAFGKRPLRLGFDPGVETYWIERQPSGPKPETMSQQF
jgi:hypothetical protein